MRLFVPLGAVLLVAGCAHDMHLRMIDGEGEYVASSDNMEGMAITSGGQRRVMFRESHVDSKELTGRTSMLLYLSFPVIAGKGVDMKHPQAYFVWSDISAEFSGVLNATSSMPKQSRELHSLSGTFSGQLHPQSGNAPPRDVTVTLKDVPVRPAASNAEFDRHVYSEMLREHLHRLEFDKPDQEDGASKTAPGAKTPHENH